MNEQQLAGKVAIVTGGGRGIGRLEALSLARAGAKVIVSDFGTNPDGRSTAEIVAREICELGGEAEARSDDLMRQPGPARVVGGALDCFGGIDILVNNAGLRGGNPIHKMSEEQWDNVLDSHLKASFLMIKEAVPHMRVRGGGVIINTGSEAGLGMPFNSAYAAAKEGLAGLTRSVAREQGRFNIRCNLLRPRATAGQTGGGEWFQQKLLGDWQPLLKALGPYWIGTRGHAGWDRPAPPDSIAALVVWLCTPAASNLNGRDFFVGGDEIALLSQPEFSAAVFREGGWTVEALDRFGHTLTKGLADPFRVPNPFSNDD
jgi:NAD(P)-dependent dehydrogenase (short-subunit alcohol dehydrogenase family)